MPKAYQTSKPKKSLVVKGVPAEVTEQEFKEFLDLNKINYAKAERLTGNKDGRVLEIFKLRIKDDTEAEALITENLTCPITGIIYRGEEFPTPILYSSAGTAKVSDIRPKLAGLKPNALSVGRAIIIKDAQIKRKKQPKCANCKGPYVASYKGCPAYKKQAFRQHVVDSQKFYTKTRLPHNPRIRLSDFRLNNL